MNSLSNTLTVNLQIALNKRMHEIGKISYDTYSKVNEILISRLTKAKDYDTITHSERI